MRTFFIVAVLALSGTPGSATGIEWDDSLLVQLAVSDLDVAISFYTDVLGWELISRDDDLH